MPKGTARPKTRQEVKKSVARKYLAASHKTPGVMGDVYRGMSQDIMSGKVKVKKRVQKRK